jgi:hypothetical protein
VWVACVDHAQENRVLHVRVTSVTVDWGESFSRRHYINLGTYSLHSNHAGVVLDECVLSVAGGRVEG